MTGSLLSICRCNNEWMSMSNARQPVRIPARDSTLRSVIRWMKSSSRRFWTYHHGPAQVFGESHTLESHIYRWGRELGEWWPYWASVDVPAPDDPSFIPCIERSGIKLSGLDALPRTPRWARPPKREWNDPKPSNHQSIYKSIRRYLVKHVLGCRVALMVWIGKNQLAVDFRERLAADPYIKQAWFILRWMQCSAVGSAGAKRWFKAVLGHPHDCFSSDEPVKHWAWPTRRTIHFSRGGICSDWIADWLNANEALVDWPTDELFEHCSTNEGFLFALFGLSSPLRWWAWLDERGKLAFGARRRRITGWTPAHRTVKSNGEKYRLRCEEKLHRLRLAMGAQVIRMHDDGTWKSEPRRTFAPDADLRRARLNAGLGIKSWFGTARDPSPTTNPDQPWLLRSLDFPVCVNAENTVAGVRKLKAAVRAYVAYFGKPEARIERGGVSSEAI
ncbi:hypothetical protein PV762_27210 [Mitsuaria sp. CC2]|uniref:hypothetical protein n=1 Tax=Mitsuaria sp. CC2 TaxID=3029186 RepID=UPI003B8DA2DC